jgi:hypothetical protein
MSMTENACKGTKEEHNWRACVCQMRPADPIPCILFGQLAVDKAHAGKGIGSALLRHALERCVAAADTIGGWAVIVRAIDAEAEAFWTSCGFTPSRSDSSILFRLIDDIAAWFGECGVRAWAEWVKGKRPAIIQIQKRGPQARKSAIKSVA